MTHCTTAQYLHLLDPSASFFNFQTFGDQGQPELARIIAGPHDMVKAQLKRLNDQGAGVFVAINQFPRGIRKKDQLERVRAVWCDWDKPDSNPPQWPIEPSIIVQSSPGKWQYLWLVDGEMTADTHAGIMARLIAMGSDPGAKDLARVLRVPGYLHQKGEPFTVELYHESGIRYSVEELVQAFPPVAQPRPRTLAPRVDAVAGAETAIVAGIVSRAALLTHQHPEKGRHAYMTWIGSEMQARGVGIEYAEQALALAESMFRQTDSTGKPAPFNHANELKAIQFGHTKDEVEATRLPLDQSPIIHDYSDYHEKTEAVDDKSVIKELMPQCVAVLVRAHLAANLKNQPELAVAAALATLSIPLMRRFRTSRDAPLALYQIGVADTGEGKEFGRRMIQGCADAGEHSHRIVGGYKSGSAVQWSLLDAPGHLALIDEFGKYLQFAAKDGGAHASDALTKLMEYFNSSQGKVRFGSYSKKGLSAEDRKQAKNDEGVYAPTIGIYAVTTPGTLYKALSSDSIKSGLLNRFLVTVSEQPPQRQRWDAGVFTCPPAIAHWMQEVRGRWQTWADTWSESDDADRPAPAIHLKLTPEAQEVFMQLDAKKTDYVTKKPEARNLLTRTVEKAERIAAIVTLGDTPHAEFVDADAALWASEVAWQADLTLFAEAEDHISDNEQESMTKRVYRVIREGAPMLHRDMVRKTQWLTQRARNEIVATLMETGQVEIKEVRKPSGRMVKQYVAR